MEQVIKSADWPHFCRDFSDRNRLRATLLQHIQAPWARLEERGLPLLGIDLEQRHHSLPDVMIMLGDEDRDPQPDADERRHLCHTVRGVLRITLKADQENTDQVLLIEASNGDHTVLHLLLP